VIRKKRSASFLDAPLPRQATERELGDTRLPGTGASSATGRHRRSPSNRPRGSRSTSTCSRLMRCDSARIFPLPRAREPNLQSSHSQHLTQGALKPQRRAILSFRAREAINQIRLEFSDTRRDCYDGYGEAASLRQAGIRADCRTAQLDQDIARIGGGPAPKSFDHRNYLPAQLRLILRIPV
jgi:hypothetical protein